jgi:hypothetical protein
LTRQPEPVPAVCGGIGDGRFLPRPSRSSNSRSAASSFSAIGSERNSYSSRDDSIAKRAAKALIVRCWRYAGLRNSERKETSFSDNGVSGRGGVSESEYDLNSVDVDVLRSHQSARGTDKKIYRMMPTHELFARARDGGLNVLFVVVTLFARLGGVEPAADAQTLPPVLALTNNDLLHRMKTPSRLHLEKHKLIPSRWDALCRDGLGLRHAVRVLHDGVQLERAAPLPLPELVVRQGHVEDVRDASRADDIVVVEQVAALAVGVDRHVLLHARQWSAARDGAQESTELG